MAVNAGKAETGLQAAGRRGGKDTFRFVTGSALNQGGETSSPASAAKTPRGAPSGLVVDHVAVSHHSSDAASQGSGSHRLLDGTVPNGVGDAGSPPGGGGAAEAKPLRRSSSSGNVSTVPGAGDRHLQFSSLEQSVDGLEAWRQFLTQEQQHVFAQLRNDAAVVEETLRLQQAQVHFGREEAEMAAMHARAERYLEEEQEQESADLLALQAEQALEDADRLSPKPKISTRLRSPTASSSAIGLDSRHKGPAGATTTLVPGQPLKIAIGEHFMRRELAEQRYSDLQKAYRQLQLQQTRSQRARESFNLRMAQKEERQARERRELLAADARKSRNQQMMLDLEAAAMPKEKRTIALKIHAAAAGQMKAMQTKVAEQLREMQLMQQRNAQKAFEYDQACKMAQYQLEAAQLAAMQKLQREHELTQAAHRRDIEQKMFELKGQQRKEMQQLIVENLRRKQRAAARKLQRHLQWEAQQRQEARRAGMEADFVEFLSVLQTNSESSDSERQRTGTSYTESFHPQSHVGWEEEFMPTTHAEDVGEAAIDGATGNNRVGFRGAFHNDTDNLEKRMGDQFRKEADAREEALQRGLSQLIDKQAAIEAAVAAEHKQALKVLQRKHQQGASQLQSRVEEEMKAMRAAHVMEKQALQDGQEKALASLQQAITLEHQMASINEEHKQNLNDFLAFICHELRNPLCGVSACLELIQTHPDADQLDPEISTYVENMANQTDLMKAIVNDVLDIKKIEEGKLEFVHVPFGLRSLIDDIVFAQRSYAQQLKSTLFVPAMKDRKDATKLVINIAPDIPEMVVGDPTRLRQIVSNLLSNAVKFTPEGTVTLEANIEKRAQESFVVHFAVKDTGVGISRDNVDRLFKKYNQASAPADIPYKVAGTGLGLVICKSLVHQMGGEIGLTSQLGKGSTFWFTLPLQEAPPSEGPATGTNAAAGSRGGGSPGMAVPRFRAGKDGAAARDGMSGPSLSPTPEGDDETSSAAAGEEPSFRGSAASGPLPHAPPRGGSSSAEGASPREDPAAVAAQAAGEAAAALQTPPFFAMSPSPSFTQLQGVLEGAAPLSPSSQAGGAESSSPQRPPEGCGNGGREDGSPCGDREGEAAPPAALPLLRGRSVDTRQGGDESDSDGMSRKSVFSDPGGAKVFNDFWGRKYKLPSLPPDLKVLLAEDSPVLQRTGVAMLKRAGIDADVAEDGAVALSMCEATEYHLVILDIQMPKYTGDEVARKLRAAGFANAIVACTANAMPHQVSQYSECGMDQVLIKPYTLKDLIGVLEAVLTPLLEEGANGSATLRPLDSGDRMDSLDMAPQPNVNYWETRST